MTQALGLVQSSVIPIEYLCLEYLSCGLGASVSGPFYGYPSHVLYLTA